MPCGQWVIFIPQKSFKHGNEVMVKLNVDAMSKSRNKKAGKKFIMVW